MKKIWLLFIIALTSCSSSTQITSTWKNPAVDQVKVNPILVVGVMDRNDTSLCRLMEERFINNLKSLGYIAYSSVAEFGYNAFDRFNEEEPLKNLSTSKFKSVITIELLDKEKIAFPPPPWLDNHNEWNYRPFVEQNPKAINNFIIQTQYVWESNFYDLNDILLVYSVSSKSYEPPSTAKLAVEYSNVIINDMVKKGIIKKQVVVLKAF